MTYHEIDLCHIRPLEDSGAESIRVAATLRERGFPGYVEIVNDRHADGFPRIAIAHVGEL